MKIQNQKLRRRRGNESLNKKEIRASSRRLLRYFFAFIAFFALKISAANVIVTILDDQGNPDLNDPCIVQYNSAPSAQPGGVSSLRRSMFITDGVNGQFTISNAVAGWWTVTPGADNATPFSFDVPVTNATMYAQQLLPVNTNSTAWLGWVTAANAWLAPLIGNTNALSIYQNWQLTNAVQGILAGSTNLTVTWSNNVATLTVTGGGSGGGVPPLAGTNVAIYPVNGSNQINVPASSFDAPGAARAATNALIAPALAGTVPAACLGALAAGANVTLTLSGGQLYIAAAGGGGGGTPVLAGTNTFIIAVGGSNQINVPASSFDAPGAALAATNLLGSAAYTSASAYDAAGKALAATNLLGSAAYSAATAFDAAGAALAATNSFAAGELANGTNAALAGAAAWITAATNNPAQLWTNSQVPYTTLAGIPTPNSLLSSNLAALICASSAAGAPWVNVKSFGATGSGYGVTDDTAAITNAYNACNWGGILYFPSTTNGYWMTVTNWLLSKPVHILGDMMGTVDQNYTASQIIHSNANATFIVVSNNLTTFENITLNNICPYASVTGGCEILQQTNSLYQLLNLKDVTMIGGWIQEDRRAGGGWFEFNCFHGGKYGSISIQNLLSADAGDWLIEGGWIGGNAQTAYGILIQSSGGGKILGVKFNGGIGNGIINPIHLHALGNTSDLFIGGGTSIENQTGVAILIDSGGAFQYQNIQIDGVEFYANGNPNPAIELNASYGPGVIQNFVIQNITQNGTEPCNPAVVELIDVNNGVVDEKTISNTSGSPILSMVGCSNVVDSVQPPLYYSASTNYISTWVMIYTNTLTGAQVWVPGITNHP